MSQVIEEETGGRLPVVVLSGPSFASEVARGLPAAVLAASSDAAAATRVQEQFRGPGLRLYVSDDVPGVEIGGALKNVIAIAAGAVEGLGLGHNAMAALITRGLVEISRLACAEGGGATRWPASVVLAICPDVHRRPQSQSPCRYRLGRGRTLDEVLSSLHMVAKVCARPALRLNSARSTGSAPDHRPDGGCPRGPMFPPRRRRVAYGTPSARRARSVGWFRDRDKDWDPGSRTGDSGFGRLNGAGRPKPGSKDHTRGGGRLSACKATTGDWLLVTGYW